MTYKQLLPKNYLKTSLSLKHKNDILTAKGFGFIECFVLKNIQLFVKLKAGITQLCDPSCIHVKEK